MAALATLGPAGRGAAVLTSSPSNPAVPNRAFLVVSDQFPCQANVLTFLLNPFRHLPRASHSYRFFVLPVCRRVLFQDSFLQELLGRRSVGDLVIHSASLHAFDLELTSPIIRDIPAAVDRRSERP